MTTVPVLDAHTTAIVKALRDGADLLVGDGQKPTGGGWQDAEGASPFAGYVIVYQQPVLFDGPLADTHADLMGIWQVTAVGATRQQAADLADTARTWLLTNGRTGITIAGRTIADLDHDGGAGVERDDDPPPPLFYAVDRYRITTTPT